MLKNKTLLWLDDVRDPIKNNIWVEKYAPEFLKGGTVIWVKSYVDFVKWITEVGLPTRVSFDHDLADEHYAPKNRWEDYNNWATEQKFQEKTGMDCVKWLVEYCLDNKVELPIWTCHSANPSGVENMSGLLTSFMKHNKNDTIFKK